LPAVTVFSIFSIFSNFWEFRKLIHLSQSIYLRIPKSLILRARIFIENTPKAANTLQQTSQFCIYLFSWNAIFFLQFNSTDRRKVVFIQHSISNLQKIWNYGCLEWTTEIYRNDYNKIQLLWKIIKLNDKLFTKWLKEIFSKTYEIVGLAENLSFLRSFFLFTQKNVFDKIKRNYRKSNKALFLNFLEYRLNFPFNKICFVN
jgi:hypothetical protein